MGPGKTIHILELNPKTKSISFLGELAELQNKLNTLENSYKMQVENNKNVEKKERNNLFKLEMELEAKISAYDQEMFALKVGIAYNLAW